MGADVFDVERATDYRLERAIGGVALGNIERGVAQVANVRREVEAQQVHEPEDVISEVRRVGVVRFDPQIGFVIQQTVEHVGPVAHPDVHDLGVERRRAAVSGCSQPCCQYGSSSHPRMKQVPSSLCSAEGCRNCVLSSSASTTA